MTIYVPDMICAATIQKYNADFRTLKEAICHKDPSQTSMLTHSQAQFLFNSKNVTPETRTVSLTVTSLIETWANAHFFMHQYHPGKIMTPETFIEAHKPSPAVAATALSGLAGDLGDLSLGDSAGAGAESASDASAGAGSGEGPST